MLSTNQSSSDTECITKCGKYQINVKPISWSPAPCRILSSVAQNCLFRGQNWWYTPIIPEGQDIASSGSVLVILWSWRQPVWYNKALSQKFKNKINVRIKILLVTTTYRYSVVPSCDAFSLVPSIWIVLDNQTSHGSVNFRTTSYLISVKTAWKDDRDCTNSVS